MNTQIKLSAHQRIDRAVATIMRIPELTHYVPLLTLGELCADPTMPTAYTDGRNIKISPQFVDWCTDAELVFVLLHEAEHIGMTDMLVMQAAWKEDPQLANAACDYANNYELRKLCAAYPRQVAFPVHKTGPEAGKDYGLYDDKYADMSAIEIYRLLRQKAEQMPQMPQQDAPSDGNGGNAESQSSSKKPKGAPGDDDKDTGTGTGTGTGDDDKDTGTGTGDDDKDTGDDDKDTGKDGSTDPVRQHIEANSWDAHDFAKVNDLPADEQAELVDDVREAVAQGGMLASRAGVKSSRKHEVVLQRDIPWHEILADFVKTHMVAGDNLTTWRQYRRSLVGQGIYMPSRYDERMHRLIVARDTSGSIGQAVLNQFNAYLVSVCEEVQPEELVVLDWGSSVVNDERYNAVEGYTDILHRTRVMGGGGTSPEVIGAYLREHNIEADCLVVLTDGVFSSYNFAEFGVPTLWCVESTYWDYFHCPFGRAVSIKI